MNKHVLNEREKSPSENAWEEYKNLIGISLPKRIKMIDDKLSKNGQTIFNSEVIFEMNNAIKCINNLKTQYGLNENVKITKQELKQMINECVREVMQHT